MRFRLLVCVITLAPTFAQTDLTETKPQMVWQGQASGTTFLYVRAKRLRVESKDGATVENQRYRFRDSLPQFRQDVRLHVAEGRGYVHIVEQPRADNDYTLTLAIEDRQEGSSFYSLALYWDAGGIFDRPEERGRSQIKWSGRVEDEVVVSCSRNRCTSEASRGVPAMQEHFKFSRPLPQTDVEVRLENAEGRGDIRLVEQPAERNGYTARVQIRDPQSGTGDYAFKLSWKNAGHGTAERQVSETGLVWSGRVQGTVRVTVHGGGAMSAVVAGQPVTGERAVFERPLPARSDLTPSLRKRQGRGTVDIVEFPGSRNGYQLVFEIRDSGAGSDLYEVEVSW